MNNENRKIKLCLIGNICSPQNQGLVKFFLKKNYKIYFISSQECQIAGVKTYFLPQKSNIIWYFLSSLLKIRRIISQIQPDIIHGQDLVFAGIWAYLSGFKPYVVTPWGSDVMNYENFINVEKYFIKKTLENANLVTYASEALRNKALKIARTKLKTSLVHFGVDVNIFKKEKKNLKNLKKKFKIRGEKIIYCPRSIAPIYNTDILITAFSEISKKGNYKLFLTRQNVDEDFLIIVEKLVIKHNLVDKVIFISGQGSLEMAKLYNLADVVLSLTSSDGCSVSFLEAMACEKKIVATNLPYLKDWYNDKNIWLVPIRDAKLTAKAISEALKLPENKWRKIGKRNRQLIIERAEIKSNFEKLDKLYQSLFSLI